MIEIEIPGFRVLQLAHLVLDYNGTLAVSGNLIEGVKPRLILPGGQPQHTRYSGRHLWEGH